MAPLAFFEAIVFSIVKVPAGITTTGDYAKSDDDASIVYFHTMFLAFPAISCGWTSVKTRRMKSTSSSLGDLIQHLVQEHNHDTDSCGLDLDVAQRIPLNTTLYHVLRTSKEMCLAQCLMPSFR